MGEARHRVVIADDAADVRLLLATTLEVDGTFEVVGEAADGGEVVAKVAELRPDIVLLDLVMPRIDGLSAIADVRAAAPGCRVVVLTAMDAVEMAEAALARGAHACLNKSVAFYELVPVLRGLVARPGVPGVPVPPFATQ